MISRLAHRANDHGLMQDRFPESLKASFGRLRLRRASAINRQRRDRKPVFLFVDVADLEPIAVHREDVALMQV